MATIKQIEGSAVHQIQSGQVIVDLCSVVKELVENSLDAGATSIDVRFKNQGIDSIEVQDNGAGISPNNYETIALKHYTSKLSTYSDLTTLQTFGFRGEALSSLCALSVFSITTCLAADAPKGTNLEFEISGQLKNKSVVAARTGTTVLVENLFHNLPVRRRELERNIKREYGKVIGVLGQYACIQTGIKFSVSQQPSKGKKTTVFSTKGNQSTRENIVNVFGAKTLSALVPLDLKLELEPTTVPGQRWSTLEDGDKKEICIVGHISRPASGEGRQTPDRQMFFVNARPCGLPQIAKAFNEVYKSYNASQSPFIFANIELDTHLYDVNVSPDKRTILLHDQSRMLDKLKLALIELFESQDYTVPVSQLPSQKQPSYKQLTISRESTAQAGTPRSPQTPKEALRTQNFEQFSAGRLSIEKEEPTRTYRMPATGEEELQPSAEPASVDDANSDTRSGEQSQESLPKSSGAVKHDAVSSGATVRANGPESLLSNWLNERSEDRPVVKTKSRTAIVETSEGPMIGKRLLLEKLKREAEALRKGKKISEDPESSIGVSHGDNASQASDPPRSIEEERALNATLGDSSFEVPIPAIQPPSRLSSASSSRPTNSQPPRAPTSVATITIGDHTVTSSIGTPLPKRPRRGNDFSQRESSKAALPSFGNILSQRFGLPGGRRPSVEQDDTESSAENNSLSSSEDGDPMIVEGDVKNQKQNDVSEVDSAEEDPDSSLFVPAERHDDGEYLDEETKKSQEEVKVREMIAAAEAAAAQPSEENVNRAKSLLGGVKRKELTLNVQKTISTSSATIAEHFKALEESLSHFDGLAAVKGENEGLDSEAAEEKLSLTISKSDFLKMKIVGQFNLGFILATRAAETSTNETDDSSTGDELFIIDQHASDEKYNFERLQATTVVQSQRLVHPKILELTAMEEEIVVDNLPALEHNGFIVKFDSDQPVGQRCQIVSLPVSRETTFSLTDLEELLVLLQDGLSGAIPRPSKVRKMFAMRACRSSIMIGRTLTHQQMGKVVQHLGQLDKPWNCPHGRPTMRHLCGLGGWNGVSWEEGDGVEGERVGSDWAGYVRRCREREDDDDDSNDEEEEDDKVEKSGTEESDEDMQ